MSSNKNELVLVVLVMQLIFSNACDRKESNLLRQKLAKPWTKQFEILTETSQDEVGALPTNTNTNQNQPQALGQTAPYGNVPTGPSGPPPIPFPPEGPTDDDYIPIDVFPIDNTFIPFAKCGNGRVEVGEECDLGTAVNGSLASLCNAECRFPICGNFILDSGEECDDGNLISGDGCSKRCLFEFCGNSIVDPGEQCDDGNKTPADFCSPSCLYEICGNGILDPPLLATFGTTPGEQCDDGNLQNGDGCSDTCQKEICGDGIVTPNEQCDPGTTATNCCSASCMLLNCACFSGTPTCTPIATASPSNVSTEETKDAQPHTLEP